MKGSGDPFEQEGSLSTLYTVLITYTQLWAPFMPFLSEYLFQRLRSYHCDPQISSCSSVLLTRYPTFTKTEIDHDILRQMTDLQRVSQMVRSIRCSSDNHNSSMVPIKICAISHGDPSYLEKLKDGIHTIQPELNVQRFKFESLFSHVKIAFRVSDRNMGKEYKKDSKAIQSAFLELSESNQDLMKALYFGKQNKFRVDIGTDQLAKFLEFEYPSSYFDLVAIPMTASKNHSLIDNDLMIQIDPTYDSEINHIHQTRLLHSAIQQSRKKNGTPSMGSSCCGN